MRKTTFQNHKHYHSTRYSTEKAMTMTMLNAQDISVHVQEELLTSF